MKSSRLRKMLDTLVIGLLCVMALEAIARIVTRGPRWVNPRYVAISKGFPALDTLIEDTQKIAGLKYYDEFLYAAGPGSTTHITFTDYYSARWAPASIPLPEAEHIVWTFGGSTMENTETTDYLAIANTWAKIFNQMLGPTHVKNFGTGGFFSSYELIKFQKLLRDVPEGEHPSMAIFYDGYNDSLFAFQYGPGNLQKDLLLKLRALVEHKNLVMWIYATSRMLSKYSKLWDRSAARWVEHRLFPLPKPSPSAENLTGAVQVYTRNVRMIRATCEAFQIHCLFILQPLIVTKKPLTALEQEVLRGLERHPRFGSVGIRFVREFYDRVVQQYAGDDRFINASSILDRRAQADFYDFGHTSVETSPIIGQKTAQLILTRLSFTENSPSPLLTDSTHPHQW